MAESITISTEQPEIESMQYAFLREEGLRYLERLSGKLWTDYNLSDPGVTILEVLSYAITDLGYRTTYSVPDILAQHPQSAWLKNFYSAREILPMNPVTFNDFRKILIDVEVETPSDKLCPVAGVKNAWIQMVPVNEIPVYTNYSENKLSYEPENPAQPDQINIRPLYDVLLELGTCDYLGDLNENTIERSIRVFDCGAVGFDVNLCGVRIFVYAEFPRWDNQNIDWNDPEAIGSAISNFRMSFEGLPSGYRVEEYRIEGDEVLVVITRNNEIVNTTCIQEQLNTLLFDTNNPESFVNSYQRKVKKVLQIVKEVRRKLMASRNLCEDFIRISALKVEEIAVCGDIVISPDAVVEEVEANILFAIRQFLSPTVYFYTLEEMFDKGYRSEEIFEGPRLQHGFIDDKELINSGIRESIHVSDLIQIIMDTPGVEAVRGLQIANIPLDNTEGIKSQSVKWCLKLAFNKNYVPRLSVNRSNFTFLKDELPYSADSEEVNALLENQIREERPQKLHNVLLDIPVPKGTYRDLSGYESIQEDFPLVYGVGSEGLPAGMTELRKAQTKQLKGFLLFFDQLLADYLSQLSNIGELFSMNGERNENGEFVIDKTYYSQSLQGIVPDIEDVLIDPLEYPEYLQDITEGKRGFDTRRNRFLNHLMARFGEQFTDYALLVYKISGKKSSTELLVDKLNFLDQYPEISGGRFTAFNYESPCEIWSVDNVPGVERRVELLSGIDTSEGVNLSFLPEFQIIISPIDPLRFSYKITLSGNEIFSVTDYLTEADTNQAIEKLIVNGVDQTHYTIVEEEGTYRIAILCRDGEILAWSDEFATAPDPNTFGLFVDEVITIFSAQYYDNPESNRNNLLSPFFNYYNIGSISADMAPDPPRYLLNYTVNHFPEGSIDNFPILRGPYIGYGKCKSSAGILVVDTVNSGVTVRGDLSQYLEIGDVVIISDSADNNGEYTIEIITINEPTPGAFETVITFTAAPVLQDTLPRGVVLYNTQNESELVDIGMNSIDHSLFDLSERATYRYNYRFSDFDSQAPEPYYFHVVDSCGEVIGTSEMFDFNTDLAEAIENPNGFSGTTVIKIIGSTENDGTYTVDTAEALGAQIAITVQEVIPGMQVDGTVFFEEKGFTISSANKKGKQFEINGENLALKLFVGDVFSIVGATDNNGEYTIQDILYNPVNDRTTIWVNEIISDDSGNLGELDYAKELTITRIEDTTSTVYVTGGADEFAVQQMIRFMKSTFFSHEGMHMVEHILLRPKNNQKEFFPFGVNVPGLETGLTTNGNLRFRKKLEITGIDAVLNTVLVQGDVTAEFTPIQKIWINNSDNGVNDKEFDVLNASFTGTETALKLYQPIPDPGVNNAGRIEYYTSISVTTVTTNTSCIVNEDVDAFVPGYPLEITGSEDGLNDGIYQTGLLTGDAVETTIEITERQVHVEDRLLAVNLDADCTSCKTDDPYSFILTVVLPSWQGRFSNQNFRAFFDRTFRLECPAHIVPNICWIDYPQMKRFERAYKKWLVENSKENKNTLSLNKALADLIEVIDGLRSVYPKGLLHDCDIEDTIGENTIVLDRTSLGTN